MEHYKNRTRELRKAEEKWKEEKRQEQLQTNFEAELRAKQTELMELTGKFESRIESLKQQNEACSRDNTSLRERYIALIKTTDIDDADVADVASIARS